MLILVVYCSSTCICLCIPYSQRDPIFVEGQCAKISRSNLRGWTFQNCSTHNTRLVPPLIAILPLFELGRKVKQQAIHRCKSRRNGMRIAFDRGYVAWLSRVQGSLGCCCWKRACERYRDPFTVAVMRSGVVVGHVPGKISIGMFDVLKMRWGNQLQSY